MNQLFVNFVSNRLESIITHAKCEKNAHNVIVLLGLNDIVDISKYKDSIVDPETFGIDGDATVFDEEEWFGRVFMALRRPQDLYLLSYQQYVYYISYAPNLSKFKERVAIVYDNVRSLFPIRSEQFMEKLGNEGIEERPDSLPIYQAEQVSINGKTYCSFITPTDCITEGFFKVGLEIEISSECDEVLEIDEHMYSLDVFLNEALLNPKQKKILGVKRIKEIVREEEFKSRLSLANGFLDILQAGRIVLIQEEAVAENYTPRVETIALLKKYWGENASFRDIMIYQNPGDNSKVILISQGQIVDTIIDECKKCIRSGLIPDDIFITAPTGAGKSLLFQLPAFYVSQNEAVSIVVSPLIALMKDQVQAIKTDRGFDKVAYLNSELNLIDRERIIDLCKEGKIDVLYMSPELLLSYDVSYFIGDRRLGLMVIDEAHLITTWGRDFRVDYWHLGNHVNKIRKYREMHFPIVAVTATAIYGGPNDMVVDSMSSLYMHNPHLFLGQVRRNNIHFVLNNYTAFDSGYRRNKIDQTVSFIKAANNHNWKTVVYAPYSRHVQEIVSQVGDIALPYYGTMSADQKEYSYSSFKGNERLIMVCTKAFGMGVDIPDIQVIYHHAPSGLLPDYVQEIGRVARDPRMIGFAALNYHENDKQYSTQLFGMSSIRQWQIREVLKKVYSIYLVGGKHRNMLVSSEDFSYIFNDNDENGTKVKTALMMIEKDYLSRTRYNALIARPKQMFVKCYGRTDEQGLSILEERYNGYYKPVRSLSGGQTVVELDLDEIWKKDYSDMPFGLFKRDFFSGKLLTKYGAKLIALTKFSLSLKHGFDSVWKHFSSLLDSLEMIFNKMGYSAFTEDDFISELEVYNPSKAFRQKLARYALSSFSGRSYDGKIEDNAFLQRREYNNGVAYLVFNQSYKAVFADMKRVLRKMFEGLDSETVTRFYSSDSDRSLSLTRLGNMIELIDQGTYECKGGDNPMIFIRINDPDRIRRDSENPNYINELLRRTIKRHEISNEIFDHFFTNTFSSKERWDFIEEFFLGATNEELFEQFPQTPERNHVDIIDYIAKNSQSISHDRIASERGSHLGDFPPRVDEKYFSDNLLTIEGRTLPVSKWLSEDPVNLDIVRKKYKLHFPEELLLILMSSLRKNHREYYRETMGLNLLIEFDGYDSPVAASIPYSNDPVAFYKWWKKAGNREKVYLSSRELHRLFIKVYQMAPNVLSATHVRMIKK